MTAPYNIRGTETGRVPARRPQPHIWDGWDRGTRAYDIVGCVETGEPFARPMRLYGGMDTTPMMMCVHCGQQLPLAPSLQGRLPLVVGPTVSAELVRKVHTSTVSELGKMLSALHDDSADLGRVAHLYMSQYCLFINNLTDAQLTALRELPYHARADVVDKAIVLGANERVAGTMAAITDLVRIAAKLGPSHV